MKMPSQLEDWHPRSKSISEKEALPQKEDSLRKYLPNRNTATQTGNQKPTESPDPERRLIKTMSSQQEDRPPRRKSQTQQKVLTQKEDSSRKYLPNRKTDAQTGSHEPNRKICPREDSLRKYLANRNTATQTANQTPNRNTCPRKQTYYENAFPTGRLAPKQQIPNPTGGLAP